MPPMSPDRRNKKAIVLNDENPFEQEEEIIQSSPKKSIQITSQLLDGEPLGRLNIKFIEAKLFRNTEIFGEMDPYMQVLYKDNKYQTTVIEKGGRRPVWNEAI